MTFFRVHSCLRGAKTLGDQLNVIEGLVDIGHHRPGHPTGPITIPQRYQISIPRMLSQPPQSPTPDGSVSDRVGFHVMFNQPTGPWRHPPLDRFDPRGHVVARIDRFANVMEQRREEEFLQRFGDANRTDELEQRTFGKITGWLTKSKPRVPDFDLDPTFHSRVARQSFLMVRAPWRSISCPVGCPHSFPALSSAPR